MSWSQLFLARPQASPIVFLGDLRVLSGATGSKGGAMRPDLVAKPIADASRLLEECVG